MQPTFFINQWRHHMRSFDFHGHALGKSISGFRFG
jgi:hypothetical protein